MVHTIYATQNVLNYIHLEKCEKNFFLCVNSKFIILKKCNIYIDSMSFIQMLWPETLLVSCNILGNELILNRNPNLNYQPKPVLGHNTGFNFLMSACRIKEQARKICTTLTNMIGGWKYFWKKRMVVSANTNGNQMFF